MGRRLGGELELMGEKSENFHGHFLVNTNLKEGKRKK
jgi:hypothetical protein